MMDKTSVQTHSKFIIEDNLGRTETQLFINIFIDFVYESF